MQVATHSPTLKKLGDPEVFNFCDTIADGREHILEQTDVKVDTFENQSLLRLLNKSYENEVTLRGKKHS